MEEVAAAAEVAVEVAAAAEAPVVLLLLLAEDRPDPSRTGPQEFTTRKTRTSPSGRTRRRTRILVVRQNPTLKTIPNPWRSKPRLSPRQPRTSTRYANTYLRCRITGSSRNVVRLNIHPGYSIVPSRIRHSINSRSSRCTVHSDSNSSSNSSSNNSSRLRFRKYSRTRTRHSAKQLVLNNKCSNNNSNMHCR